MKIVIVLSTLLILIIPDSLKEIFVLLLSLIWLLYTIYFVYKFSKIIDKNQIINTFSERPPNHNNSSYIRFLYSSKIDYEVFIASIIELINKESIALIRKNKCKYYIINKKNIDEDLTKNELLLKKILFSNIGNDECVSLDEIKKYAKNNSGYFSYIYNDWKNAFKYETVKYNYFKPIKGIIDSSLFYFMSAFIIAIFNIIYTKNILIAIFIFLVTSILIIKVNNYSNRENTAKEEYNKWLEFKNYIKKPDNELYNLDNKSLENYATYAYVLDTFDDFKKILDKKFIDNPNVFCDSMLLSIINLNIFDDVEKEIKDSLKIMDFKSNIWISKNKGRNSSL